MTEGDQNRLTTTGIRKLTLDTGKGKMSLVMRGMSRWSESVWCNDHRAHTFRTILKIKMMMTMMTRKPGRPLTHHGGCWRSYTVDTD